jgi:regulation of enolase protein 1 (concanavalin A-like superfamily)
VKKTSTPCRSALRGAIAALIVMLPGTLAAQVLPGGWAVSDVGGPMIPGYATQSNGTFSVSAAGSGIGGPSDQFTFVHRDLTGDGTVVARIGTIVDTHRWAAAGLMIRQTLTAGSRHAFVFALPTREIGFLRRTTDGGPSARTMVSVTVPVWLKLERRGATLTASWSPDGAMWTAIGSDTVSMNAVVRVGLALTSHAEATPALATFSNVNVAPIAQAGGPLPQGWSGVDIGAPAVAGRSTYDQGTFGLSGAGTGIDGSWDEFHFAYTRVDGDLDVVARVGAVGNTTARSKAGLMIRDTLTPNGAHASIVATSGQGTLFQRRQAGGASTVTTVGSTSGTPVWVKLTVRGGTISAYESMDGVAWTLLGTDALTLPSPFLLGLAVTSHDPSLSVMANVDQLSIQAVAPQPNQSPTAVLTAPQSGTQYTAPATITVAADATDPDGTVSRVDFYAGSTLIGSDSAGPYSVTWSNVPAGTYSLTAIATDNAGASTTSAPHTMTVAAAPQQQRWAVFTPSSDHSTLVNSYVLEIFPASADPSVATPIASRDLGKPGPVNNEIRADITATFWALAPGSYKATVSAVGNGGSSRSAPFTFTR